MPGRKSLPDTLKRSPDKAQRTWIKAHDGGIEQYGEGEGPHRTVRRAQAFVQEEGRALGGETFGGVDYYGSTKDELYGRAKKLDVAGRSNMTKKDLARAIARKQ